MSFAGEGTVGARSHDDHDDPLFLPRFGKPWGLLGKRPSDDLQRLIADMAQTRCRAGGAGQVRSAPALNLLSRAAAEFRGGHHEAAWELSLAARRELVRVLDDHERCALAISVQEEAEKLAGWRSRAIRRLTSGDGASPTAAALIEAIGHIDAAGRNQARGQRVLRRELAILAAVLLGAGGILLALIVAWLPNSAPQSSATEVLRGSAAVAQLATDRTAILAVLFGITGACISSMQRATSRPSWMRVPSMRAAMWVSLTRPIVGAVAGLVVWSLTAEGALSNQASSLLTLAFAAGFSERVILRFIPETPDSGGPSARKLVEPKGVDGT